MKVILYSTSQALFKINLRMHTYLLNSLGKYGLIQKIKMIVSERISEHGASVPNARVNIYLAFFNHGNS